MPNASASEITISSGETEVMFSKKLDLKISLNVIGVSVPLWVVISHTSDWRHILKMRCYGDSPIEWHCEQRQANIGPISPREWKGNF